MKTKLFILLVSLFVCPSLFAQQRIIGGSTVDISQRPFQVGIFVNGVYKGGGVIINNQWILTAAHLADIYPISQISISSGYTNLNNDTQRKAVSQKIIHPDFSRSTKKNDIALLKLSTPLSFSSTRQPINISQKKTYASGTIAIVAGWGQIQQNVSGVSQLRKTNATIESCTQEDIKVRASTSTAYVGDSGSPLTLSSSDIELIGLVSHGIDEAPTQNPTYYTNVGTYYNWIKSYVDLYSISGPDLLCSGSTSAFTISAPGATLAMSPNLSIVSQSGKNVTIRANSNGRAYINIEVGNTFIAQKAFWVGAPIISGITYDGYMLQALSFGGDASINRTEWTIGSNIFTSPFSSISSPYSSGTYKISVRASNSCGTGSAYTTEISFSDRGTFSLSSEPGSHIVTVMPIQRESDNLSPIMKTSSTMRYALANLTTGSLTTTGVLPVSGGTLDFTNAPDGLYVLKLYTATGGEESFKIVLK